jgi:hypothetical protein
MMGSLGDLLFRPDSFFESETQKPESFKLPGIIVVIGAVISAVSAFIVSETTNQVLAQIPEISGMASLLGVIGAIFAFIFFIIFWWLIFSGIFYGISMAFSGKGDFKRTLETIGLGLVPVIIGLVISLFVALYYIPMVEIPVIGSISDPAAIQMAIAQLLQDPAFSSYRLISTIISVIFLLWSANLWIFGMKHARNLSVRHAAVTVLVPVIIYIIIILVSTIGGIQIPGGV